MTVPGPRFYAVTPDGLVDTPDGDGPPHADGTWHVLACAGTRPHPALAALLRRFGAARPDLHVVYGDAVGQPAPEFDGTRLIAQEYAGLPLAVRGSALAALDGLDPSAGTAAAYDLLLRAMARGLEIGRIPEVLGIPPQPSTPATNADRMRARQRALPLLYPECDVVPGLLDGTAELRGRFLDLPPVTLMVLPSRSPVGMGAPALQKAIELADWPANKLHVLLEARPAQPSVSLTARANHLRRFCDTELVVLLASDAMPQEPDWLRALLVFAAEEGVGGVGGRLLGPDGMVLDPYPPFASDAAWAGLGGPDVQRESLVAGGSAFATRRSVLDYANGLDERFGLQAAQADLCLRLRLLGWRIVHTPHAAFVRSGPAEEPPGPSQLALFLERWQHALAAPAPTGPAWWSG